MRTTARSLLAGVAAYIGTYLLIGLFTITRLAGYLQVASPTARSLVAVYRDAGSPAWQAIGWLTLNAHGIPLTVTVEAGRIVSLANLLGSDGKWLGLVPGWLGMVPAVACLLAGAAVTATSDPPAPVGWHVGTAMVGGYVAAVLASILVFSGTVGPVNASFALIGNYPPDRWLLPVVLAPLLFGSLGAAVGRTPTVRSAIRRARVIPATD